MACVIPLVGAAQCTEVSGSFPSEDLHGSHQERCHGPLSFRFVSLAELTPPSQINVGAFAVVSPDPAGTYHPPLPAPWTAKNVPNAEVIEAFSNWSDLGVKKILREMGDPSCWSLHSVGPVLDTFVNGRIALIGDAVSACDRLCECLD